MLVVSLLLGTLHGSLLGQRLVRIGEVGEAQAGFLDAINADVWALEERTAVVRVNATQLQLIEAEPKLFWNCTVLRADLQAAVDEEARQIQQALSKANADPDAWFTSYHRFEEIKQWFAALAKANDQIVHLNPSIGRTHDKRDIFALHFSGAAKQARTRAAKPKIWVQCLIHAREWISGSVCQAIAAELAAGYRRGDKAVRALLDEAEVVMVPVVNPDGYVFSWGGNRLWRKNGRAVDLNRNFADHWAQSNVALSPSSDLYCGTGPASEPETKAVQAYFASVHKGGRVAGALDWHSFSQLILRPIGWSHSVSPHDDYLKYASNFMAQSMGRPNGRAYKVQRSSELYLNSGSATDWFYGKGVRYSLAVELPPSVALGDSDGFLLPPSQIKGVCQEAFAGFLTFADFALHNPL